MSRIAESTVQAILDKTDIVALVSEQVRLQKAGKDYRGLCPFHAEKTPSFYVVPDKGIFHCFGCGKGGDAAKFLMESEKLSWPEAIRELGRRAGVEVEESGEKVTPEDEKERQSLYDLYERLSKTFAWFLESHPSGERALRILETRKIGEGLRREFRLGYAPAGRDWLKDFLSGKGYSPSFLAKTGLFAANRPDWPLFADRLMFPILDPKGRCISFGGRLLQGEGPKYINGPETMLFRKQETLFALDKARESIRAAGRAIVCEGYMDALSFHAAGIRNAVAPLGTAFTDRQASLLRRHADGVVFAFDSDTAGQNAIARGLPIAARAGLEAMAALLPGGKDASEILEKEGPESLHKIGDLTISGGDFLISRARDLFDVRTVEGKAKAVAYVLPYAQSLDSEVKRDALFEAVSRQLRVDPMAVKADFEVFRRGGPSEAPGAVPQGGSAGRRTQEFAFLLAVATHGEHFAKVRTAVALDDLDDPRARELYMALEECFRSDAQGPAAVAGRIGPEDLKKAVMEAAASGEFDERHERLVEDGILNARFKSLAKRRDRVLESLEGRGVADIQELLAEKMHLDAELERLKEVRDERP